MIFGRHNLRSYNKVSKVNHAGYSFASGLEAALFDRVKALELAGEISNLKLQPKVYLTDARIMMIPDFACLNLKLNQWEWWEAKGFETDVYRIKRKLWTVYGPGLLHVFGGSKHRLIFKETITPKWQPKLGAIEEDPDGL